MARLVGMVDPDFAVKHDKRIKPKKSGTELTTEGILEGIRMLAKELDENPDNNWLVAMVDPQFNESLTKGE